MFGRWKWKVKKWKEKKKRKEGSINRRKLGNFKLFGKTKRENKIFTCRIKHDLLIIIDQL